jgi:hypothetical protein
MGFIQMNEEKVQQFIPLVYISFTLRGLRQQLRAS